MPAENQRKFSYIEKKEALKKAEYRCQRCKNEGSPENPLTIHHNFVWQHSAREFSTPGTFVAAVENAVVLCRCCHDIVHDKNHLQPFRKFVIGVQRVGEKTNQEKAAEEYLRSIRNRV